MPTNSMRHRIWDMVNRRQGGAVRPAFALAQPGAQYGIDALDAQVFSTDPTGRYRATDATANSWPAWTYGETLTTSQTLTLNTGSPWLGANDDSWYHASAPRLENASWNPAVGTNDFVFEWFGVVEGNGNILVIDPDNATADTIKIQWSTNKFQCTLHDGTNTVTADTATTLVKDCWQHIMCFADRSANMSWFVNGSASGTPQAITTVTGSLTGTTGVDVGHDAGGGDLEGRWGYMAFWVGSGIIDGTEATVAAERSAKAWGYWEQKGVVTTRTPSTSTRSTVAWHPKVESSAVKYYPVAPAVHNVCTMLDSASATVTGFNIEDSTTQYLPQSHDFSNGVWTQTNGSVGASSTSSPFQGITAYDFTPAASAGDVDHYATDDATSGATNHTSSVYVKKPAGGEDYVYFRIKSTSGYSFIYQFSTGTISAVSDFSAGQYGAIDCGNGWIRLWGYEASTAGRVRVGPTDNSTVPNYDAGASPGVALIVACAQIETSGAGDNVVGPSSWIETAGGTATRDDDNLTYSLSPLDLDGTSGGAHIFDMWVPDHDSTSGPYSLVLSQNAVQNNEFIRSWIVAADNYRARVTAGGVIQTTLDPAGDIADGDKHSLRLQWATNSATGYTDGTASAEDTTVTQPDSLDTLDVGQLSDDSTQLNGVVGNLRMYVNKNGGPTS